ncbi:uncharacterized protein LOC124935811 [Impatiens glandulifera]|uniref:uncharacterized protein LOC124935811 n=1 Tax=Impatiens glandulifera TaxID=253017 RepID=UPI001FB184E8|nr:uncharacterized protein LOC124935811 [Impatiens glandulifera]
MGKSFNKFAAIKIQQHLAAPSSSQLPKVKKPISSDIAGVGSAQKTLKKNPMENSSNASDGGKNDNRTPLSLVVSDCVRRWFQDTLKEAKAGDISMQVLVGQMYNNGYGISKDAQKARAWMSRASRIRSSVWKVSNKRPGYNASDSDSDDEDEEEDTRQRQS